MMTTTTPGSLCTPGSRLAPSVTTHCRSKVKLSRRIEKRRMRRRWSLSTRHLQEKLILLLFSIHRSSLTL